MVINNFLKLIGVSLYNYLSPAATNFCQHFKESIVQALTQNASYVFTLGSRYDNGSARVVCYKAGATISTLPVVIWIVWVALKL